jgi:GTP-binding protein
VFADSAKIFIKSGKGGDGHVSFRRELYVPAGGPDGGDGGKGGDIIFQVDEGLNTLTDFRHIRKYAAEDGKPGSKKRMHGADGADLVIKVPRGTVIKEFESQKIIADMSGDNRRMVVLRGGRGGRGNMNFATPVMQAPKYAQPGQSGRELWVSLELKVIADVGLVGFPNAGKSTLLSRVSNARPKIANYPFTTLNPFLGIVDLGEGRSFCMADIPGLIEGASEGVGLGHDFLKHIERTKVLVHVVDIAGTEGRDPLQDVETIDKELSAYNQELAARPQVIAANKIDVLPVSPADETETTESYGVVGDALAALRGKYAGTGIAVMPISAVTGQGVKELLEEVWRLWQATPRTPTVFAPEFDLEKIYHEELPFTVEQVEEGVYRIGGPRIDKMLGYTNLESEKGFAFFQNFIKDTGVLQELEEKGIHDGDTVQMKGFEFLYYK